MIRKLWIFFCSCLSIFGCSNENANTVTLWSEEIANEFGKVTPISIHIDKKAESLAKAADIPLLVVAYGSGSDINVSLIPKKTKNINQASLSKAAMSAALTFYQCVINNNSSETRPIRATIYQTYTNSGEYNVIIADVIIAPPKDDKIGFDFPGPAWSRVEAVDKVLTPQEIKYLQQMQLRLYDWKIKYQDQEAIRGYLTKEQDIEISKAMGIAPGTIDATKLQLKPLVP